MQKHPIALGHFFLAVFCVLASAQEFVLIAVRFLLLLGSLSAFVTGIWILHGPFAQRLGAFNAWLVQMFRLAQQPPVHESTLGEKSDQ